MDYQDILKNYRYDTKALERYGFIKEESDFFLTKELTGQFIISIRFNDYDFNVAVLDKDSNEEYVPFRVSSINGSYVQRIRDLVDSEINRILASCFTRNKLIDELLEHLLEKYQTIPDYPFGDESMVFRVNNKWYGLVMQIDKSKIMNSHGKCTIINLKIDKDKIPHIIDNKNIFQAYHMNKKYWISVLIDNNLDMDYLFELIDESYNLVLK